MRLSRDKTELKVNPLVDARRHPLLHSTLPQTSPPGEDGEPSFDGDDETGAREKWQTLVDNRLIEWGRNPADLADEGFDPPTAETIQIAIRLAKILKDTGFEPPDRIVPDPNGGIVFELKNNDVFEALHVWEDGAVEYQRFQDSRLIERWSVQKA